MGEEIGIGCLPWRPKKPDIEDYECDGCRATGFTGSTFENCGSCPYNDSRIREYERKYGRIE